MKTLMINSEDEKNLHLLQLLADKLGLQTKLFSDADKEEFGLLKAMMEGSKGDYVSEEEVLKALKE